MVEVDKPPIDVDQIMARIRERLRARREAGQTQQGRDATGPLEKAFSIALKNAQVGVSLPLMYRQSGVKRTLATLVARLFLRLAQLITQNERIFNEANIDTSCAEQAPAGAEQSGSPAPQKAERRG